MPSPRIILYDVENAPNVSYTWGKWEQNVIEFQREWFMLSFAYKVLGEKKTHVFGLPDFPGYDKAKDNDKQLVKKLHTVLDSADIVITHNGDSFDNRKAASRFVYHGLKPPSPFKSIDTLKIARRHFRFESNKLDDIGKNLGVGRKLPHTGFKLWLGCMEGDPRSWRTMKRYNAQDVVLLEHVFEKVRPWAKLPDLNHYTEADACPTCQSDDIKPRGFAYVKAGKRQRFQCDDCGTWFSNGPLIKG